MNKENEKFELGEEPVLFTKEEIEKYGITPEDLELFNDAEALSATVEMLPEDADKILERLDKEIPDDYEQGFKKLAEIAEKDPKFFQQILALYEVTNSVREVPPAKTEKVSLDAVEEAKREEAINQILAKLK